MGAIEEMTEEARALHKRFDAYLTAREAELHEQNTKRRWLNVTELAETFSLHRDSIDKLVRDGKAKGIVRVAWFRLKEDGKVMQRVELTSFERYLEAGGIEAEGRAA